MPLESRPKIAPFARLRWDKIEGRHVLLSPERGLALNATATEVVVLCDGSRTVDDIVQRCCEAHGAASGDLRDAIEADVRAWVRELVARGLLVE